jgi:acyl-CoA reductase-like NAD-dependent aldehyde dehydrogenase
LYLLTKSIPQVAAGEEIMSSTPYIAGKNIDVPPSSLSDVVNPANQRPFARIFMAKAEHMSAAIDAADAAKSS